MNRRQFFKQITGAAIGVAVAPLVVKEKAIGGIDTRNPNACRWENRYMDLQNPWMYANYNFDASKF